MKKVAKAGSQIRAWRSLRGSILGVVGSPAKGMTRPYCHQSMEEGQESGTPIAGAHCNKQRRAQRNQEDDDGSGRDERGQS